MLEITSWKVRAYDFYSQVEKYRKTNKWVQQMSEFSNTLQRLNKNRTHTLSMLFVYFIGTEIYLRIFVCQKIGLSDLSQAEHEP